MRENVFSPSWAQNIAEIPGHSFYIEPESAALMAYCSAKA
jgi:hypothetical protein